MKKVILALVCAVFVLWSFGSANAAEYAGSDSCFKCHPAQFNDWKVSGHPYKVQKAEIAKTWMLPLPEGYSWDDISYVLGGAHKKSRYMDKKGYIITMTGPNKDVPGKNQYNLETGTWSDYHPGEKIKMDCGKCHTTGYKKEGHQDGLEGIVGTWAAPGIHCEACHGPASDHVATGDKSKIKVDKESTLCGECHIRGAKEKIPAGRGFINHHEQYNELIASPHKDALSCVTCHNPHKRAKFSIKKDCAECHTKQAEAYGKYNGKRMHDVGIKCIECHMPKSTKSATAKSKTEGDIRTHVFKINTDPKASMFYKEPKLDKNGKQIMKDDKPVMAEFSKGFVTLDFACLNCHKNKDMKWASEMAKGIHKK